MIIVGAIEAETHLARLIDQVAAGQDVLITRNGMPVARLIRAEPASYGEVEAAISDLKTLRKGVKLSDLDWEQLRDTGRS